MTILYVWVSLWMRCGVMARLWEGVRARHSDAWSGDCIHQRYIRRIWVDRGHKKKATTYSPVFMHSTIGATRLNFSVRNGKRCLPSAIATLKIVVSLKKIK